MKYEVEMTRKILYNFQIEADSEDEAELKAYEMYDKVLEDGTLAEYKYDEDTYRISWKWWCANIIRVLFFWESPFDDKNIDEEKLIKLIKQYSPEYMKKK